MKHMTTLSEVLNNLREEGYTVDFNLGSDSLHVLKDKLQIYPDDFVVDRHYRFEGMSDPSDQAVVYAISSSKFNLKGVVVNGYGIYADDDTSELMKTIQEKAPLPIL